MSSSEQWRKYGEQRRKELLERDNSSGGTSFDINRKCRIDRYFALAERVANQFQIQCNDRNRLEESYVMGHRLLSFLQSALPQHPEYFNLTRNSQRQQCQNFLAQILEDLERVALLIDEDQLNLYMDLNFDPADNDTVSSSEDDDDDKDLGWDEDWENFTGWFSSAPAAIETDSSSKGTSSDEEFRNDLPDEGDEFPDPGVQFEGVRIALEKDEDTNSTAQSEQLLSFLNKVANEDFCYETDSDAVDSWAQEDDESSLVLSGSSGVAPTCDPARIAFREIMNNMPRRKFSVYNEL